MSLSRALRDRLGMFARLLRLPADPPAPPVPPGVRDGRLAPCPRTPNCVSSRAPSARHAAPPLRAVGSRAETMRRLRAAVEAERGARVVEETPTYLRAEVTTRLWRFVDDVEFLWDGDEGVVHLRSASRIGRSDLGENRRRIERIRRRMRPAAQEPA